MPPSDQACFWVHSQKPIIISLYSKMQALWDNSSVSTFSVPPITTCYQGGTVKLGCKIWTGTGTVVGNTGLVTVYPTLDGTATGTPVFTSTIMFASVTGSNSNTLATFSFGSLRTISASRQAVSFNMLVGQTVLLGGDTLTYLAAGRSVTVFLFGI